MTQMHGACSTDDIKCVREAVADPAAARDEDERCVVLPEKLLATVCVVPQGFSSSRFHSEETEGEELTRSLCAGIDRYVLAKVALPSLYPRLVILPMSLSMLEDFLRQPFPNADDELLGRLERSLVVRLDQRARYVGDGERVTACRLFRTAEVDVHGWSPVCRKVGGSRHAQGGASEE